jgi:hypothetical protein
MTHEIIMSHRRFEKLANYTVAATILTTAILRQQPLQQQSINEDCDVRAALGKNL